MENVIINAKGPKILKDAIAEVAHQKRDKLKRAGSSSEVIIDVLMRDPEIAAALKELSSKKKKGS